MVRSHAPTLFFHLRETQKGEIKHLNLVSLTINIKAVINILLMFSEHMSVHFIKMLALALIPYSVWLAAFDARDQPEHQWEKSTL